MHHRFVYWPCGAVTRNERLLRREGKGPVGPYVDKEGYPKHAALVLIKNTLKQWLEGNIGFCISIGGPGARARHLQIMQYYVYCIGKIRFRISDRNFADDAACNSAYLLLGDVNALSMINRFMDVARRASQRCRPHGEFKA